MNTIANTARDDITTAAILCAHTRMELDGCMSRSDVLALADSLSVGDYAKHVALDDQWVAALGHDAALDLFRRVELATLRSCAESIEEVMADCSA